MRSRRRSYGFTLIELLIVVGIIITLVGILVPAVGNAKRQAQSATCLSNLRQVGMGFVMYARDNQGMWPVVVHEATSTKWPLAAERRWYDLVSSYVTSIDMKSMNDIDKGRQTILWGCPEWRGSEFDPTDFAGRVRPGYGMNPYPSYFDDGNVDKMAYVTAARGRYVPMSQWTKPDARGLVADSITHVIQMSGTMNSTTAKWFPFDPIAADGLTFYVDTSRHNRKSMSKKESYMKPSLNMLFCDGHAATVSVRQAWNAIHNPGQEKAGD